ncbi:MAG: hypothetical protein RIS47_538 [Bacteroidota bacterium]|jgi:hypothetical protein
MYILHKLTHTQTIDSTQFCVHPHRTFPSQQKIMIWSGSKTFQISPAAGYPLVVLANGNRITWRLVYFSQTTVQKAVASTCCGLPLLSGLDRAPLSKPTPESQLETKQLAYGHVASCIHAEGEAINPSVQIPVYCSRIP